MDPLEQLLLALVAAVVQALAAALAPVVVQQVQKPSTAQDGYSDAQLQAELRNAIADPGAAAAD